MRVSTAKEMQAIDQATIVAGTPALDLMERAGQAMAERVLEFLDEQEQGSGHEHEHVHDESCGHHDNGDEAEGHKTGVLVICGKGNNGGDGLVVARLISEAGCPTTLMLLAQPEQLRGEALANYEKLPEDLAIVAPEPADWAEAFDELGETAEIVVDGMLGTGLHLPLRPEFTELIRAINDAGIPCLALDIPSGVSGDDGAVDPVALAVDVTVTVGLPKRGLLLSPGRDFAGEVEVADIGFSPEICAAHTPDVHWLRRDDYLTLLPQRTSLSHKYTYGTLVLVAGSHRYSGAAILSGMGALRSGVGLVSMIVPEGVATPVRVSLPEVVTAAVAETEHGTLAPLTEADFSVWQNKSQALAIGPGLDNSKITDAWVCGILARQTQPVVVDADGLGAFSRLQNDLQFGANEVVLTPHAGEFARLVGLSSAEVEARRFELVAKYAQKWQAVVMLKGAPSLIAAPDGRVFINASGDDALAHAGSGDVLTGLIGGFLAQGLSALDAALFGAYVHGLAGTAAAQQPSSRSVLVREIAAAIGPVLAAMEKEASAEASLRERIWPVDPEALRK